MPMSAAPSPPAESEQVGPRIVAYIERVKGRESMRAWCERTGLNDVRVSQWKSGKEPSRESIMGIARALGMNLGQFYVTVLGMERAEFLVPDLDYAIDHDPTLFGWQRKLLHEIVEGMRRQTDPATGLPHNGALTEHDRIG